MADHSAEIENCPPPQDAQVLKPLTDLLKGGGGQDFAMDCRSSGGFPTNKVAPSGSAVPLQHPAPNAEVALATDTSNTHIGGVMQQKSKDLGNPLVSFLAN